MSDLETTEGGLILVPRRVKTFCHWCGAAYERRPGTDEAKANEGITAHETQCRIGAKHRLIHAVLAGPLSTKGAEAVLDMVHNIMASVEAGERAMIKETL